MLWIVSILYCYIDLFLYIPSPYRYCFTRNKTRDQAIAILKSCRSEVTCHRQKKNDIIREKIRGCILPGKTPKGHFRYKWTVGAAPNDFISNTCKTCFSVAYKISETTVDDLILEIKVRCCS